MTVVHNHPHPLSQRYVKPSNPQILAKFGIVRIEDWDDRVAGFTWIERHQQGAFKEVEAYLYGTAPDRVLTGTAGSTDVVRCHTQSTGDLVLLHDDWLKDAEIVH